MENKIRDIKGFCKLFDLNIPDYNHFDYYISQLYKLNRYKNIYTLIELYETAEADIDNLFEYRMDKSKEIIEFLENTRAYNELNLDNLIVDLPISKSFQYQPDKKYLSIDMKEANWSILKKYDPDFLNELDISYKDFLSKFSIPELFHHSKSFRQFIFGNINPKRQSKAQRVYMEKIIKLINNLELECIKNDELIYSYEKYSDIENEINKIDISEFKIKLFSVDRVEDFRIDTIFDSNDNILYQEMIGCNGNMFYLNLKKYILKEKIDVRDLYFRMDGNLAIWSVDKLKVSL